MMIVSYSSLLANSTNPPMPPMDNIYIENIIVVSDVTTYYGKNNGTTITTVTDTDGSTTTVIDYDCDSFYDYKCYSVEKSPAGLTKLTDATNGVTFKGILIDANPAADKYKLLTSGSNK